MVAELKEKLRKQYADTYPQAVLSLTNEALRLEGERDRANVNLMEARETIERLQDAVAAARRLERGAIQAGINGIIKAGDLPGDGTDQTAQRNGLILASNFIHSLGIPEGE